MESLPFVVELRKNMGYQSPPDSHWFCSRLPGGPTFVLYSLFVREVLRTRRIVLRKPPDRKWWQIGSARMIRAVERAGGEVVVTGLEHVHRAGGPVVIIGNHMSTMETVMLPCILLTFGDLSFVVKESLLTYPFFGPIMREVEPVAVSRQNPREDLTQVMKRGQEALEAGRSVVIFPQSTRSRTFDTSLFNSLGVKLARRAGVPVVPMALKTDMWSNGKLLREFGLVDPKKTVRYAFGPAMTVEGTGKATQAAVVDFITTRLHEWGIPVTDGTPE